MELLMDMPGQRRVTRKSMSDLRNKGMSPPGSLLGAGEVQPTISGSLAEQAAQMENFEGFDRISSEEFFIRNYMESGSMGSLSSPTTESMGIMPSSGQETFDRNSSEELFSSWISTSTSNQNEAAIGARSPSRRIRNSNRRLSSELAAIIEQQNNFNNISINGIHPYQRVDSLENAFMQAGSFLSDNKKLFEATGKSRFAGNTNKQAQSAPDLFQSKTAQKLWFQSTVPVTRSQSSEIRTLECQVMALVEADRENWKCQESVQRDSSARRVAEIEAIVPARLAGDKELISLITRPNTFDPKSNSNPSITGNGWPASEPLALPEASTRISDPSSSNSPPVDTSLSAAVGRLRGSLDKAKQRSGIDLISPPAGAIRIPEDGRKGNKSRFAGLNGNQGRSPPTTPHFSSDMSKQERLGIKSSVDQSAHGNLEKIVGGLKGENFQPQSLPVSQSADPSGGAPRLSMGTVGNGKMQPSGLPKVTRRNKSMKRGSTDVDQPMAEPISIADVDAAEVQGALKKQENLPQKPDVLTRMGSITSIAKSGGNVDVIDDATKKRRVDRQRKMAESKGRGATAVATPVDSQAALKRVDALEKEVRSLKMTLAFMNRKDSEQTKRIEELEEQNQELRHVLELVRPS